MTNSIYLHSEDIKKKLVLVCCGSSPGPLLMEGNNLHTPPHLGAQDVDAGWLAEAGQWGVFFPSVLTSSIHPLPVSSYSLTHLASSWSDFCSFSKHLVDKQTHQPSPDVFTIPDCSNSKSAHNSTCLSLQDIRLWSRPVFFGCFVDCPPAFSASQSILLEWCRGPGASPHLHHFTMTRTWMCWCRARSDMFLANTFWILFLIIVMCHIRTDTFKIALILIN